jgi:hypothetical protein
VEDAFSRWCAALEERHLSELRFAEVRRALQALSSLYVERRHRLASGAAFDGAGKRAAFALFYGPLHWLTVRSILREIGTERTAAGLRRIADLGCGTGVAGAAWALEASPRPTVEGVERNPWAVAEARWTLQESGTRGRVVRGDLSRTRLPGAGGAVALAWTANELADAERDRLLPRLLDAAVRGARVLVVEPIARRIGSWWGDWAEAFRRAGGRCDEWRLPAELPDLVARLDRAAGLDHGRLTARSLWLGEP